MKKLIIFTHIPKTAGTSFVESVVRPNLSSDKVASGGSFRSFMRSKNDCDFIYGHMPYGKHIFTRRPVEYITFLRDPIDRAISWYFFIKGMVRTDIFRRHPLRNYADTVSIAEFYENPKYSNMQTRYLAGLWADKAYPRVPSARMHMMMLQRGKKNLEHRYACFGIQDRFEESIQLMQHTFGWQNRREVRRQKSTGQRPSVAELHDLAPDVVQDLEASHRLDRELYMFAQSLFEERLRRARSSAEGGEGA